MLFGGFKFFVREEFINTKWRVVFHSVCEPGTVSSDRATKNFGYYLQHHRGRLGLICGECHRATKGLNMEDETFKPVTVGVAVRPRKLLTSDFRVYCRGRSVWESIGVRVRGATGVQRLERIPLQQLLKPRPFSHTRRDQFRSVSFVLNCFVLFLPFMKYKILSIRLECLVRTAVHTPCPVISVGRGPEATRFMAGAI